MVTMVSTIHLHAMFFSCHSRVLSIEISWAGVCMMAEESSEFHMIHVNQEMWNLDKYYDYYDCS